jgi:hypothetical protein
MYKVLLTTDDPSALLSRLARRRRYRVSDEVMLNNVETDEVAEYYVHDFQRHPFLTFFKWVAKVLGWLLVGFSLLYMLGVFACGMVVAFSQFDSVGLALLVLAMGILFIYGYMAGRRPVI